MHRISRLENGSLHPRRLFQRSLLVLHPSHRMRAFTREVQVRRGGVLAHCSAQESSANGSSYDWDFMSSQSKWAIFFWLCLAVVWEIEMKRDICDMNWDILLFATIRNFLHWVPLSSEITILYHLGLSWTRLRGKISTNEDHLYCCISMTMY